MKTLTKPVLVDDAVYLLDGGMVLCGKHCGMTARYTGRDLSGQRVSRVTLADACAARDQGWKPACETCGRAPSTRNLRARSKARFGSRSKLQSDNFRTANPSTIPSIRSARSDRTVRVSDHDDTPPTKRHAPMLTSDSFDTTDDDGSINFDPQLRQPIRTIREMPQLTHIAGEAADGAGALFYWDGKGPLKHAELVELATDSNIPTEWLPSPPDAIAQLAIAIRKSLGSAFVASNVKKKNQRTIEDRTWASRWILTRKAPSETDETPIKPGEKYGEIVCVATLYADRDPDTRAAKHSLEFDTSDLGLSSAIQTEYDLLVADGIHQAGKVTEWLDGVFQYNLDAVRSGGDWYVPAAWRSLAELITSVFSAKWGTRWRNPPLPIMSCAQLSVNVAEGLKLEIGLVIQEMGVLKAYAAKNNRENIGKLGAESVMVRLRRCGERVATYADTLGVDGLKDCQAALHDAMVELDGVLGAHDFNQEWRAIVASREERAEAAEELLRVEAAKRAADDAATPIVTFCPDCSSKATEPNVSIPGMTHFCTDCRTYFQKGAW